MKFLNVYNETEENLRLALISLWAPGNHPMRQSIEYLFKDEPLITEPVFQSTFGWEQVSDDSWRDCFNPTVLTKLKIGQQYPPYKHQAESWKFLRENKSIVVTSGTGSGKTECFMYPVINDLYEQGALNSIQALFLYPLNALMEDQKKRLSDMCSATGLRFAVYNGDTPEYNADGRDNNLPNEVETREKIRDNRNLGTRPQILLTNPSMLEYVLVRQKDRCMLDKSKGKLRWIVIDEAHTYSGSAAIELAYQIKRVLHAFGVSPEDVRFACTSATIGGEDGTSQLIDFISDIIGQDISQISSVGGIRNIPPIDDKSLSEVMTLFELSYSKPKYIQSFRKKINRVSGMSLQQIWEWLCPGKEYDIHNALTFIDTLCEIKIGGAPVLSLRAHFFMRSISGLYACANDSCPASSGTPFGYITTYKAGVCKTCGKPLLEIVQCKRCSSFILMGECDSQSHVITPFEDGTNHDDYFAIDEEKDELFDTDNIPSKNNAFYILPFNKDKLFNPSSKIKFSTLDIVHSHDKSILEHKANNDGKWVELRKDATHSYCAVCGSLAYGSKMKFKYFRIPLNFINQAISPVLLQESAPELQPWGKYIAFTDSRQGTAISAKTFNIDIERRICIERVMQDLAIREHGPQLIDNIFDDPRLATLSEEAKQAIRELQADGLASPKSITLEQLATLLVDEKLFDHIAGSDCNADKLPYKYSLIRQFVGTRSLYDKSAESMGLITLEYPALSSAQLPDSLAELAEQCRIIISDKDWQDYLKITIDFLIRQNNHIEPLIRGERNYIRDAFLSKPIAPHDDPRVGIDRWVGVKINVAEEVELRQSRLVLLLCAALGISTKEDLCRHRKKIDHVLADAWDFLVNKNVLTKVTAENQSGYNDPRFYPNGQYIGCYYLDLSPRDTNTVCRIKRTKKAWICPVTNTLLDTIFCGYSPLIIGEISTGLFDRYKCIQEQITMPARPRENSDVKEWQNTDACVTNLKAKGFWSDRNKYAYYSAPAYIAAEHSAQQSKDLLREYTKGFSANNPSINVLHCSTTMEMGVDIGDIDIVLMDTVPPTAANYMQRVGRAGRKNQTKSIAFSLCNNTPVGQNAFDNPMWALQSLNHMIAVLPSQTIIQRHINSFFFREYICSQGNDIKVTSSVGDFMDYQCSAFVVFLDQMRTNQAMRSLFNNVFGSNVNFTIELTRKAITDIQSEFNSIIQELSDALTSYLKDIRRAQAIANQISKVKKGNLLQYLSEHQFIPNASMPTGVVTFDFIDRNQSERLFELSKNLERKKRQLEEERTDGGKIIIEQEISTILHKMENIRRASQASREINTALNEYAPGQTVVVNEKNYKSAGIMLFGVYNEETQTRAIYHCTHCGRTEYLPLRDESRRCMCGQPFRSIFKNGNEVAYTLAYEPVGFKADQNIDASREEKTDKQYFEILPLLLKSDWTTHHDLNMCQVTSSGETGEILYYNTGNGSGFAFCKRCGRAAVEFDIFDQQPPSMARPGHKRLWGDDCDAADNDIERHVVLTGRHQTCYSVLRFNKASNPTMYEEDIQVVFSLGVILKRALVEYLGIDETEVEFGYKQELDAMALFIFDTARGGCGYTLHFNDPAECEQIFAIARRKIHEYTCICEQDGGACAKCLVDRNNYRYSKRLSKAKAIEWLDSQSKRTTQVPIDISSISPNTIAVLHDLKTIAKQAVENTNVIGLTFCVSDMASSCIINDWCSINSEMGKLLNTAVAKGKSVSIHIEYHPEIHESNADKYPFVELALRFPDCNVSFIEDMGDIKTCLVIKFDSCQARYYCQNVELLSFSNDWGTSDEALYYDREAYNYEIQEGPIIDHTPSELILEGLASVPSFRIKNYFSKVIAPEVLRTSENVELFENVLKNKRVNIYFSDMYVNSALASLMLVYLIKELRDLFDLKIDTIKLQLNSRKRKCDNPRFNDYNSINLNFETSSQADEYTYNLFEEVLDIKPTESLLDAEHHRWLRITTSDGGIVEIRPDHSISGGWRSSSTYMSLDTLDGSTIAFKNSGEILYYIIIKKCTVKQ